MQCDQRSGKRRDDDNDRGYENVLRNGSANPDIKMARSAEAASEYVATNR